MPDLLPADPVKNFISAFAEKANKDSMGLVPASVVMCFLEQMTRHLNGTDFTSTLEIEDFGEGHWAVRLTRFFGWSVGTLLPRLPFMESALFRFLTANIRRHLARRGTP